MRGGAPPSATLGTDRARPGKSGAPAERASPSGRLDGMIDAAVRNLLGSQEQDGHWRFELECDTWTEADYVLLLHFLGRGDGARAAGCCEHLRGQQLAAGGWATWPGGAVDPSRSVKAYLCLKLAGDDPRSPRMAAARDAILAAGGLRACNSYTKLLLAIFGLWPWRRAPAVPPELILLPRWFWFNIHDMSSWTRTMVVPLSLIWAHKPSVPLDVTLDELETDFTPPPPPPPPPGNRFSSSSGRGSSGASMPSFRWSRRSARFPGGVAAPWRRRRNGSFPASKAATAWARSSRPWSTRSSPCGAWDTRRTIRS